MLKARATKKRFTTVSLLLLIALLLTLTSQSFAMANGDVRPGVLVVAHGVNDPNWTTPVWETVYELRQSLPCPVALGFLEAVPPDIPAAVQELNAAGLTKLWLCHCSFPVIRITSRRLGTFWGCGRHRPAANL